MSIFAGIARRKGNNERVYERERERDSKKREIAREEDREIDKGR